jgi:hypothetical protein
MQRDTDQAVELWLIDLAYSSSFSELFEKVVVWTSSSKTHLFTSTKLEEGCALAYALFLQTLMDTKYLANTLSGSSS